MALASDFSDPEAVREAIQQHYSKAVAEVLEEFPDAVLPARYTPRGDPSTARGVAEYLGLYAGRRGSSPVLEIATALAAQELIDLSGWVWVYSFEGIPFEGHKKLHGLIHYSDTDEELRVSEEDSWLKREFYAVGDHYGCRCRRIPLVEVPS